MTDEVPFQPLPARMAGQPVDATLHDGVPDWLTDPLRDWITAALDGDEALARRVAMRLHWPSNPGRRYTEQLIWCRGDQLLIVIDAVLQLNSTLWRRVDFLKARPDIKETDPAQQLSELLGDGGSRYTVDLDRHCLTVLLDPTVTAAMEAVAADPAAGGHLRVAYAAAYGLHPNPDDAYDHAVKAVEAAACPLVLRADPVPTLGKVIKSLEQGAAKWRLVLVDQADQGDIEPVVVMMRRLWQGQRSRHGAGPTARPQTQLEAEAAVHLAVLLVQWLTAGVLTRATP